MSGGRFEFDDGGIYYGEWLNGKAHSYGVCTGPNNEGRFEGFWQHGFEILGTYSWSDKHTYNGEWKDGKINGLGVEDSPQWTYFGEWKNGKRHGSGVLVNKKTNSRYEGTWMCGLQDGYGGEISLNGACYMGQWKKGCRHGYGIKLSANAAKLNHSSHRRNFSQPTDFQSHLRQGIGTQIQHPSFRASSLLKTSCDGSFENCDTDRSFSPNPQLKRAYFSLNLRSDQSRSRESKSAGSRSDSNDISDAIDNDFSPGRLCSYPRKSPVGQDSVRTDMTSHSSGFGTMSESSSTNSLNLGVNSSTAGEIYKGEWLSDRRNIYGICEYVDGSRYIGSWKEDVRDGYGAILHGSVELSGKWRNDELLNTLPKKGINLRSPRMRAKVRISVDSAVAAAKLAMEKYKTAFFRRATARKIAESAKIVAEKAIRHGSIARSRAEQFDVTFPEPQLDSDMSPRDIFLSEPTFMAFEISKDLPPRQASPDSKENTQASSNKTSAQPAKLAGLFAAMDLGLSAGAISPIITHSLHGRNKKSKLNRFGKDRPVSFNSAQDAWSKLSSSIPAFKPGVVGATILLPGFPNIQNFQSKKDAEQEPYYYSSSKELELRNRKLNGSTSAITDSTATSKSTLVGDITETDWPSSPRYRSFSQSAIYVSKHSHSLSQMSGAISDISSTKSQASETNSQCSRTISQSSVCSSVVKISGKTAMGEQIKLGYMQATAAIDGNYTPIYCTNAPRPRLHHHSSISESKSVSAATGLYRTIVGELPAVLSFHDETDPETSMHDSDKAAKAEDETEMQVASDCLNEDKSSDVTDTENVAVGNLSDEHLDAKLRRRSLEKLRARNDDYVDLEESNRQFINHSRTHPSVFRTSSKIRRQKQIDDSDGGLLDNDTEKVSSHEAVRKTKSDIGSVHVMNSRRIQIPVRSTKSFDMQTLEDNDIKTVAKKLAEAPKRVIVCAKNVNVNYSNLATLNSGINDDFMNNNISDQSEINNYGLIDGCYHEDLKDVISSSQSPREIRNSWYCDVPSELNIRQQIFTGDNHEVDRHFFNEKFQMERRHIPQLSNEEPSQLKTWV